MNVWRLITHHTHQEYTLRWAEKMGRLAIGWGLVGDIGKNGYTSARDISLAIKEHYPYLNNGGQGGACLHSFYSDVQPGDLVILSTGGKRSLVMEVEGGYEFKDEPEPSPIGDYQHQRKAVVLPIDANKLWRAAGSSPADGHSIRWTFIKCQKPVSAEIKSELAETRAASMDRFTGNAADYTIKKAQK